MKINYTFRRLDKGYRGSKQRLTDKNTDESSLVDRIIELSDLKLGFIEVCEYLEKHGEWAEKEADSCETKINQEIT